MTLDERIRSILESAASAVPSANPGPIDEIRRRGRRRRLARRAAWSLAFVVPFVGLLALRVPYDPNPIDPASTHDVSSVEVADLAVAVADPEPVSTGPDVWLGLPGPTPSFDTSELGPDLSFTPGEPSPEDLDDRTVRAVYLGELDGESFYIYSTNAPSIWDWISEAVLGNASGDILGTSLDCCSGGDMDRAEGLPGFSFTQATGEPDLAVGQWLGLSLDVSVVAYQVDGVFVGWQTPVAGVSSIRLDQWPEEYLIVAFNARGQELDRFGPHQPATVDDVPPLPDEIGSEEESETSPDVEWEALPSEGVEIGPEEIPTDDLREVMSPREGDRLFAVATDGHQVLVLVRPTVPPHAYATSCDVLASVDLPQGWDGTCLERTVNGQPELGVFDYQEVTR